ncbi:MAG: hypothetical protein N3C12_11350 [Candidatus Binatia bacterium]|nr:hypothetical protein [Candidatus Binatia bacterium]
MGRVRLLRMDRSAWRWRCWGVLLWAVVLASAARAPANALGCPGAEGEEDLAALAQLLFRDWFGTACVTPDQNLDGRVSAADLSQAILHTAAPPRGPVVTFLGLSTADGRLVTPSGQLDGLPVFQRASGSGFQLVVEGRSGMSGSPVGIATFQSDPFTDRRPDLQVLFNRPLGDGSPAVCSGGVPAVVPPDFRPGQAVSDALNDIGCNFSLGSLSACVVNAFGQPALAASNSQIQFCATIARTLAFPAGDTIVTVRLRDVRGELGRARQILVRVGEVPLSPTAPPSPPAPTATGVPPTVALTPLRTATSTPTATPSVSPAPPHTATRMPTRTALPSASASATSTRSPTVRTPTASPSPTRTLAATLTLSPTATSASATPPRTRTPTVTRSSTPTATGTLLVASPTPTRTRSATRTPTASVAPASGPIVTFLGITRADDTLIAPTGVTADGIPIFERPTGAGFNIVVEGRPGTSNVPVGSVTFRENGPPDVQVFVSRPLGDGSAAVCDRLPPRAGGVPAVDPPVFSDAAEVINALNDLGCRFLDGGGQPRGRGRTDACVLKPDGGFDFVVSSSTIQFCGFIDVATRFPPGEVRITVRLRDESGQTGPIAQMILRIQS